MGLTFEASREDENRGSSEIHLQPASFWEPSGFLPERVGSLSTEMYLNLSLPFLCLTHPDTQLHLLHRGSQGTRLTQVAEMRRWSLERAGIVYIKTGGRSDVASFPLSYSLSDTFTSGASDTLVSFLSHHSKVCFVGVVLPASPSATTITSTTIKAGHYLLQFW